MAKPSKVEPRIYVADLAAYNSGKLHGVWIDATQDASDIETEIEAMLAKSPVGKEAEEWAIHDYEGFGKLKLGEHEDLDKIAKIAELMKERGPVFAAVVDHFGTADDLDEAIEAMEEKYSGEYDDLADWAYREAEDSGEMKDIPERFRNYIDWAGIGDDAETNGGIFTVEHDGKVHVFYG